MKVENYSKKNVPLASGMLAPGNTGEATYAETKTLSPWIRTIEDERPIEKPRRGRPRRRVPSPDKPAE